MRFFATVPYPAIYFQHYNARGESRWVVVMGATFEIGDGGSLGLLDPQPKLNFEEMAFGDVLETPIRRESDIAPEKPLTDLVVNANAYAPGDVPAERFDVALSIHEPARGDKVGATAVGARIGDRRLTVTGPRAWRYRSALARGALSVANAASLALLKPEDWILDKPAPTNCVPLRYDYAFGGTVRLDHPERAPAAEPLVVSYADNPVGRGFVPERAQIEADCELDAADADRYRTDWAERAPMIPAPQIEHPERPIRSVVEPYPLAGWGVVPKHWGVRHDKAGTFDDEWLRERHPILPKDFDPRYWNGAHPDLQFEHFPEDAILDFLRLIPASRRADQALRIRLPGLRPFVETHDVRRDEVKVRPLRMDTVHVDLLENRLSLLYRINLEDVPSLAYIHLDMKEAA